jgi:hypothetical protein
MFTVARWNGGKELAADPSLGRVMVLSSLAAALLWVAALVVGRPRRRAIDVMADALEDATQAQVKIGR